MKIKIDKTKFKFLSEDFPDEATKEELQVEIERLNTLAKYYNNKQLAEKTIINSSYGALASKYFVGFNIDVAASVTEMGRNIVKFGAQILNKYFSDYWHLDVELHKKLNLLGTPSKIERLVQRYGDSVDKDSLLNVRYNIYAHGGFKFSDFSILFVQRNRELHTILPHECLENEEIISVIDYLDE